MFPYIQQLDVIKAIQASSLSLIHPVWMFLRYLDSGSYYVLLGAVFVAVFPRRLALRYSYLICVGGYLVSALKHLCAQPRPGALDPLVDFSGIGPALGFPSGGAFVATLLGAIIIRHSNHYIGILAGLFYALTVSFSRIYLGAHFLTDVLGGWFFGLLLWFSFLALPKFDRFFDILASRKALAVGFLFVLTGGLFALHAKGPSGMLMLMVWGLGLGQIFYEPDNDEIKFAGYQKMPLALQRGLITLAGILGLFYIANLKMFFLSQLAFFLLGFWVSAGCYFVFARLRIAAQAAQKIP